MKLCDKTGFFHRPQFVQDSIDFSSRQSLSQKRRFQKVVTMPMPATNEYMILDKKEKN